MFHNIVNVVKNVSNSGHSKNMNDNLGTSTHKAPQSLEFGPGNEEAIRLTCEALGQSMETWGFKKVMGSIWAFLYLCPEPASAKDICKALSISPALVSITVQDLLRWGVVQKISPLGHRKDYYIAEHDIWKMIRKVFQEREKAAIERVKSKLTQALVEVKKEQESRPDIKSKRTCHFQSIRIEDLLSVTNTAETLMNQFIELGNVDISPIVKVLKPYSKIASVFGKNDNKVN